MSAQCQQTIGSIGAAARPGAKLDGRARAHAGLDKIRERLPASSRNRVASAAFRHHERRIDDALLFIEDSVTKLLGNVDQDAAYNFVAAPRLNPPTT